MNNILISIKPQWCNLILNGRKTLEIRKSKPNLTTPFRCYIYCSEKNAQNPHHILEIHNSDGKIIKANGKVIGEFICDYIKEYSTELYESDGEYYENIREVWQSEDDSSEEEYRIIASNDNGNLNHNEILQKSCLSLDELKKYVGLGDSHFFSWHISDFKLYDKPISIEKAPQTWCYCAKIKGEQNESDKKKKSITLVRLLTLIVDMYVMSLKLCRSLGTLKGYLWKTTFFCLRMKKDTSKVYHITSFSLFQTVNISLCRI